jgi:hypothetical protein
MVPTVLYFVGKEYEAHLDFESWQKLLSTIIRRHFPIIQPGGFLAINKECNRVLKPLTGRLAFTFHHWDPNAWAELTIALYEANFELVNTNVVFSEHPISVHINNLNAIVHDVILVLTPKTSPSQVTWKPQERIDASDSEQFCRQCSSTVGWLLNSDYSLAEIRVTWQLLIQGRTNDIAQR